ncbi:YbaB/EbfC family nucleoid-associated protein [Micromonospora sp. NBC_01412]|uniref:YbaB/EbfC family nucleoid-associated protein n=1 Tax=Micromonospora sp. NBC_01412 TaxID=2903590 RepID=UPI00324F5DC4
MSFGDEIEQLLELYQQQRSQALEAQRKVEEISVTVTAPKRALTVTVDANGNITGMAFPTEAYRKMAPAELAAMVTKTVGDAKVKALSQMSELMSVMMPEGVSMADMQGGKVPIDRVLPADIFDDPMLAALLGPGPDAKRADR